MRSLNLPILAMAGVLAAMAAGSNAQAANDLHESYTDQLQKNPRLIEPGSERLRYLVGDPREGYDERKAAAGMYGPPERRFNPARPGW